MVGCGAIYEERSWQHNIECEQKLGSENFVETDPNVDEHVIDSLLVISIATEIVIELNEIEGEVRTFLSLLLRWCCCREWGVERFSSSNRTYHLYTDVVSRRISR